MVKKKDEQNTWDDILTLLGVAVLIIFGFVAYTFMIANETLAEFLTPDNWAEFSIIGVVLIAVYCVIAFLNREVV